MLDVLGMIAAPERPRLLAEAARFAAEGYGRGRCVPQRVGEARSWRETLRPRPVVG